MITALTGEWGVGKTHYLSAEIHKRRQAGWFIISNFSHLETNIDGSSMQPGEFINLLKEVVEFKDSGYEMVNLFPDFKHTGVFIAIDEGHLYFNNEIDDRADNQLLLKLFSQLRKQDIEIMYTAQEPDKISMNWRRYTKTWRRLRYVINWKTKKPFPHPTQPCVRYELRHKIPFIWDESHKLDYKNPRFNYSTINSEIGSEWSKHSTIKGRRIRYVDPFIYKLFDSNQVLAINAQEIDGQFPLLRKFDVISGFLQKERMPSFKNLLGIKRIDEYLPTRYSIEAGLVKLPMIDSTKSLRGKNIVAQPTILIRQMKDFINTPYRKQLQGLVP